jgi:adenine-specific DNA-methyltransferase
VLALTNEDDWVFDPYTGVGSALIAAVKQSRRAMGSEQDRDYVEIARDRIAAFFNGDLRLRPMGKPVYQPTGNEKVSCVPPEWQEGTQKRLLEKGEDYQ